MIDAPAGRPTTGCSGRAMPALNPEVRRSRHTDDRMGKDPLHEEIARRAYELFEARGRQHGRDWEDWFAAEHSIRASRRPWKVEAARASLTSDIDIATLVLRLGIAVNAVRAAQRFFYAVEDAPGPAGERDRLWAFLIALGFLHEAIQVVLRPNFRKVRALAEAGGAGEPLIKEASALLSGKLPLSQTLNRVRNKLIFHWDDEPVREFVTQYSRDTVVWVDGLGDTQGEMLYRTAADALTNSVLPDEPGALQPEPQERSVERLKKLIADVLRAMDCVLKLFDFAIKGHLAAIGAQAEYM